MKAITIILILFIAHELMALKCHRCGRVENERCEKNINLPKNDCDEPSLEDKESLGAKAVCVKISRKIQKSNQTFYDRMCGFNEASGNGTCLFMQNQLEDSIHFKCSECEKDLCNGTSSPHVSLIALVVKILSILCIKKLF